MLIGLPAKHNSAIYDSPPKRALPDYMNEMRRKKADLDYMRA